MIFALKNRIKINKPTKGAHKSPMMVRLNCVDAKRCKAETKVRWQGYC